MRLNNVKWKVYRELTHQLEISDESIFSVNAHQSSK